MTALLSTTYFGPVQWYQKLYRAESVLIERWENFQKQTYRNRCVIATANGTQALTVPIERGGSQLIKDIRISDHGNWRHLHWNALVSAYGESPFFEYYQDDIRPFFEKRWAFLYDFNEEIRQTMCELIDIEPSVGHSEQYIAEAADGLDGLNHDDTHEQTGSPLHDYREAINPKHPLPDPNFTPQRYYQVYGQRHGFLPNLSILDLLFNMGPESVMILK